MASKFESLRQYFSILEDESPTTCPICQKTISDPSDTCVGEDSIICDEICNTWLHLRCAGLSVSAFKAITEDPDKIPFYALIVNAWNYQMKSLLSFKSTITSLSEKLNHLSSCPASSQIITNGNMTLSQQPVHTKTHKPPSAEKTTPFHFTDEDVYSILANLDVSKVMGINGIPNHILESCSLSLYEPVHHLFHQCYIQSCLPHEWKVHKITPIYKAGDKTSVKTIALYLCYAAFPKYLNESHIAPPLTILVLKSLLTSLVSFDIDQQHNN